MTEATQKTTAAGHNGVEKPVYDPTAPSAIEVQHIVKKYGDFTAVDDVSFAVKEGDQVSAGQEVGLSGATGRATGPHLHIAVRWQGEYLNPAVLFSLLAP